MRPDPQQKPTREKRAGADAIEAGFWAVVRACLALLGGLFILVGMVLFPLPIPLGLPLILVGLVLLARNATWAKAWIMRLAKRHPRLTDKAPNWLKKALMPD
jgi:hypothetical protein